MPDHVHFFASPMNDQRDLDRWMSYWKFRFSKADADTTHKWQRKHWDRRLRSGESYGQKWEYVANNPVRHGLVSRAEDWPYQGEQFPLDW
jgi:REP element-mobilizing transposase RayT